MPSAAAWLLGGALWRLRLTPAATGFDLSVVLGDPPRDPWA